jgi:hypothetical protein
MTHKCKCEWDTYFWIDPETLKEYCEECEGEIE